MTQDNFLSILDTSLIEMGLQDEIYILVRQAAARSAADYDMSDPHDHEILGNKLSYLAEFVQMRATAPLTASERQQLTLLFRTKH